MLISGLGFRCLKPEPMTQTSQGRGLGLGLGIFQLAQARVLAGAQLAKFTVLQSWTKIGNRIRYRLQ